MNEFIAAAYEQNKAEQFAKEGKIDVLLEALKYLRREEEWYENVVENAEDQVSEISITTPGPPETHRGTMLSSYWRWNLWEDCRLNTPDKMERLFQGLVGATFDNTRLSQELEQLKNDYAEAISCLKKITSLPFTDGHGEFPYDIHDFDSNEDFCNAKAEWEAFAEARRVLRKKNV